MTPFLTNGINGRYENGGEENTEEYLEVGETFNKWTYDKHRQKRNKQVTKSILKTDLCKGNASLFVHKNPVPHGERSWTAGSGTFFFLLCPS